MRLGDLLPSRFAMAAGIACAIFIPLAVFTSYGWGLSHRDLVREELRADGLHAEIYDPATGYRDRLTTCANSLSGATSALTQQNGEVDRLKREGDAATARAQAAIRTAQEQARVAERQVQSLLSQQPHEGESRCDAAYRLIQEYVR